MPEPRDVGEGAGVFRVQDGHPDAEQASRGGVEERPVGVGVNQVDAMVSEQAGQSPDAAEVDPRPPAHDPDRDPVLDEPPPDDPRLFQAEEHETVVPAEAPGQSGRQHLHAAHRQAMNKVADRGRSNPRGFVGPCPRTGGPQQAVLPGEAQPESLVRKPAALRDSPGPARPEAEAGQVEVHPVRPARVAAHHDIGQVDVHRRHAPAVHLHHQYPASFARR